MQNWRHKLKNATLLKIKSLEEKINAIADMLLVDIRAIDDLQKKFEKLEAKKNGTKTNTTQRKRESV